MKPLHVLLKELAYKKNVHEIETTKDPILNDRGYYEFFKIHRYRIEPQHWVKFNNHYRNGGRV